MQETFYSFPVPLSIALVADLHDHPYTDIISSLQTNKPDIICIAGDFTHGGFPASGLKMENTKYALGGFPASGLKMENTKYALSFLAACTVIAPVYVSLGNHEWLFCEQDLDVIRSVGAVVLDNSFVLKDGVVIGGLTSARFTGYRLYRKGFDSLAYPRPYYPDVKKLIPDLSWLDAFEAQPGYKILLSHHPEYYDAYLRDREIDLILSGHAHGGQVRLFRHGLFAPGQGLLPKYTSGVHGNLILTRGLSNTAFLPRFFNPTELVYIIPAGYPSTGSSA